VNVDGRLVGNVSLWRIDLRDQRIARSDTGPAMARDRGAASLAVAAVTTFVRHGPPILPTGAVPLTVTPVEVVTDAAPIYTAVLEELLPAAWHHVQRHAHHPIEADHSQLKRTGSDRCADCEQTRPRK
jgi:hypothetical protein